MNYKIFMKGYLLNYIDDVRQHEIADFLSDVVGVVECDNYGRHMLWKENHERYEWKENLSGYGVTIGNFHNFPIFISLLKSVVDGQTILFVEATSQVVHWKMIENWLNDNLPPSAFKENGYLNKSDAMNFHNVLFDAQRRFLEQ